jgi:4-amino-4-deoxy-L-arabinose transferase-like glycosyltransferase
MQTGLSERYPSVAGGIPTSAARPETSEHRLTLLATSAWGEALLVAGLLAAMFGAFMYGLSSVVISDMDEGTYLYAGKLVAQGLTPYRDFLLGHPPLAVYLAAAWVWLAGAEVMPARMANLAFVLVSTVPLYLVVRHLLRSRAAGLLAVATYMTGNLLLANMGRTIKLEPIMNAFLIAAFAIYVLRPNSPRWRVVLGALFAAALLVKLVAVIPIGLIVLGDFIWGQRGKAFLTGWAMAAFGAVLVLLPAGVLLLSQPHFLDDVIFSQLGRGGLPLELRMRYLAQDFVRFPPIPLALLASVWLVLRSRTSTGVRVSALVAFVGLAALLLLFKTFFTYYIVLVMPWLAIVFVVLAVWLAQRFAAYWRVLVAAAVVLLGVVAPLGYDTLYNRGGTGHVASPAQIVPILKSGNGYIYSMYPLFSLWSGRDEYPWYYAADALIPRLNNQLSADDFITAFGGSNAVVLWDGELKDFPQADSYLHANFRLAYQDENYSVWTRDA